MKKTLEQDLAASEKKTAEIKLAIEKRNNANKPKDIRDRVKTLKDVLKITKPTKEEEALLNYKGKSGRMNFAKNMMTLSLISEALNEGHKFSMKDDEQRWYPYFDVSSGFALDAAFYAYSAASTGWASRLCLKSQELAIHAGKIFLKDYKSAIIS